MTPLRQIWCRLFHRVEWSIYGGFTNPYVYCNHCEESFGDKRSWVGPAVDYADASDELKVAAQLNT